MTTSDQHCRRYVERQLSSGVRANRLRQDLLLVEARLEQAERHANAIRNTRDAILSELTGLDD